MTNKGNEKHEDAVSVLHNIRSPTHCLYKEHFKTLCAVVPKKSLTKYFIGGNEKMANKGNDKH